MGIRLLNLESGEDPQRQTPGSDRTRTVCNPRNDRKGGNQAWTSYEEEGIHNRTQRKLCKAQEYLLVDISDHGQGPLSKAIKDMTSPIPLMSLWMLFNWGDGKIPSVSGGWWIKRRDEKPGNMVSCLGRVYEIQGELWKHPPNEFPLQRLCLPKVGGCTVTRFNLII